MSYQEALKKAYEKYGIKDKKDTGSKESNSKESSQKESTTYSGYEAAVAKAKRKVQLQAEMKESAISRIGAGSLPISPQGVNAYNNQAKKAAAESTESIQKKKEDAERRKMSAQASMNALSAGGWTSKSDSAKKAKESSQQYLDANYESNSLSDRLRQREQQAQQKAQMERIHNLRSAKELNQTRDDALMEAARASARAQAMLSNPASANMQQYAALREQADRASALETQAKSDLALSRQIDANQNAEAAVASLIRKSTVPPASIPTGYTSAQKQAVDRALLALDNPERAANMTAQDVWDTTRLSFMAEDEQRALRTFVRRGDYGSAAALLDNLDRILNQRQTAQNNAQIRRASEENPALGAIGNAVFSLSQPMAAVSGVLQGAENLVTGENDTLDPNTLLMSGANLTQASAQGTVEGVNRMVGHDVSMLTETGLSILQNLVRLPMGHAALPFMAVGAAGASTLEGTQKGLTTGETLALAGIAGAAEYITEKIPLENILNNIWNPTDILLAIAKQIPTEATEEALSDYINLAADLIVRGANSDMLENMRSLELAGYSQKDAFMTSLLQYAVKDPAMSALGGALSGGVMGGGSAILGNVLNRKRAQQIGGETAEDAITPSLSENAQNQPTVTSDVLPVGKHVATGTLTQEQTDALSNRGDVYMDAAQKVFIADPGQHISQRTYESVGDRSVNAFQFDHPELQQYFKPAAEELLRIASTSLDTPKSGHWERTMQGKQYVEQIFSTPALRDAMDMGLSRNDIIMAAQALVNDQGKENYAAAKRLELVLDDMLTNGYTSENGDTVAPNEEYIEAKKSILGYQDKQRDSLPIYDMEEGGTYPSESMREAETGGKSVAAEPGPETSVGAAQAGFVGTKERGFSRNLATDKARSEAVQHEFQVNPQMYHQLANKTVVARATEIYNTGLENAYNSLVEAIGAAQNGMKFRPEMVVLSKMVGDAYGELSTKTDIPESVRNEYGNRMAYILSAVAAELTEVGQTSQAAKIMRDTSPASKVMLIERIVQKLSSRFGRDINVSGELIQKYSQQQTDKGRDAVLDEIYRSIAEQIPPTMKERWDSIRYLSMLGNLRTHVRNVAGNAAFVPVRTAKDQVAAFLETVVDHANRAAGGKGIQRSKSFVKSPDLYKAAWQDYQNVPEELLSATKFAPSGIGKINEYRSAWQTTSKNKAVRAMLAIPRTLESVNSGLLSAEDNLFKRITYADALSGYLKANGVTAEMLRSGSVNDDLMEQARTYAANEAMKATYNDSNSVSDFVASIGKEWSRSKNPVARAASTVVEGVLPFKRTPANILMRGIEYSPAGFIKAIVEAGTKQEAYQVIDSFASAITGTGLMVLGYLLASAGRITVPEQDEKQSAFNSLIGQQDYALQLDNGTSITIDWLAPEVLPILVGAQLANAAASNGVSPRELLSSLQGIADPMLELTMLQSINDILESAKYSDSPTASVVWSILTSYLTQAIPTILGQAERTYHDEAMTTYTTNDKNALPGFDRFIGKVSAKIPILEVNQIPYIDAWGQREKSGTLPYRFANNFLNPAYISNREMDTTETELQRLYDAGQTGVFPQRADKSFQVNGETLYLDAQQYVEYAETKGQTAKSILDAMMQNAAYKNADDGKKAEMIRLAYDYANKYAKQAVSDYDPSDEKMFKAAKQGIPPEIYILNKITR